MEALVRNGAIPTGATAAETWQNVDERMEGLYEAYARHLTVSSGAGALAPILLRTLLGISTLQGSTEKPSSVAACIGWAAGGLDRARRPS